MPGFAVMMARTWIKARSCGRPGETSPPRRAGSSRRVARRRARRGLPQRIDPGGGRLRTGHRPGPVDDEERHAGDAELAGPALRLDDGLAGVVVAERGAGLVAIKARPCGDVEKHRLIADVAAVLKIGPEQRLD